MVSDTVKEVGNSIVRFIWGLFLLAIVLFPHIYDVRNGLDRANPQMLMVYLFMSIFYAILILPKEINLIKRFGIAFAITLVFVWGIPRLVFPLLQQFATANALIKAAAAFMFCPAWLWVLIYDMMDMHPERYNALIRVLALVYIIGLMLVVMTGLLTSSGRIILSSSSFQAPIVEAFKAFMSALLGALTLVWSGFTGGVRTIMGLGPALVEEAVVTAVGPDYFYEGQVEDNKDEPLGVYLEDCEPADPEYTEGDTVVVWGNIKAKTFDKPVSITLACYGITGYDDYGNEILVRASEVKPANQPLVIKEYGEAPFECIFRNPTLGPEATQVRIEATFNFQTMAYLRTYFMRGDNLILKTKELKDNGKDYSPAGILSSYKLPSSPIAQYTNGPVGLGLGSSEPPIRVDPGTGISPYYGVTVKNDWPDGKIVRLTKLDLLVPQPITLDAMCGNDQFSSAAGEEGYNKYTLATFSDKTKEITYDYVSYRCMMNIGYDALDNIPQPTTRTLKAYAEYVYTVYETVPLSVQPLVTYQ